jgi:imidazolonepropionase-like amidohydrolase
MKTALTLAALAALAGAARAQDIAVRGDLVHTMAGEPLHDAVVLVRDGKIADVGPASAVVVPPGMAEVRAAVVTPGLIDAHSCVGLAGWLNQPADKDEVDKNAPMQPELRAVDAYNARERLIEWIRGFGVTTIHTGHAPGALISGQTLIAKTVGSTVDQAVIVPEAMIAVTLGEGGRETDEKKSPGTRSKQVAMLREELIKAQEYLRKRGGADEDKRPERDLRLEALADALEHRIPLLVTAHRHTDIESALRLQKEFDLRMVLDGGAESYLLTDEIAAAHVPVIVHPTMTRAEGETENMSMETAGKLHAAGIPIALQSGYEGYVPRTRVVLYEAAVAASNGLPPDAALAAITIDAAKLLGIDARVGSLEVGKDGDLALYDGDPFEYTSHCLGAVVNGRVASDQVR